MSEQFEEQFEEQMLNIMDNIQRDISTIAESMRKFTVFMDEGLVHVVVQEGEDV